ncbi:hypothetical protein [Bradyrhizobium japonicum]|uniref:hypothetical protein n=1 Tax=Bradyrhizobium japonicum TaxID=375 RepID=UPI0020108913|nr:hypothetical protein [Bradyrhizobium japonicum]UQD98830.1 hypothetical protein JEY30_00575 [Bradyrhizobium japonicum]
MKPIVFTIVALLASGSVAAAQGNPSGRGSATGDPAAGSSNPRAEPGGTVGANPSNRSGSGTSTSGGKDDNGDQGRDKMPEGNMSVRPSEQQPAKPK